MTLGNAIHSANSVKELLTILESGKNSSPVQSTTINASWFGRRVSVPGYSGSVNLLFIIDRLIILISGIQFEFTEEERGAGKLLSAAIDKLDRDVVVLEKNSNCIKKMCFTVCEFFIRTYYSQAKNLWYRDFEYLMFDYYTRNQYIKVFGKEPPKQTSFQDPDRWLPPSSNGLSKANPD